MSRFHRVSTILLLAGGGMVFGQQLPAELQALVPGKEADLSAAATAAVVPAPQARPAPQPKGGEREQSEAKGVDSLAKEIQDLKRAEKGPRRFAADLFDYRQPLTNATEGGIAEDYVLGTGDLLQLNAFGSATFETPLAVDGRGEVVIPKVGTVKVGGLSLGRARTAIQAKVAQNFSRTTVDLGVTKLREVRVFVLGEVYKPGSFLVPSLSSLVNVLSLAGGPTQAGSYRQIRVQRGGKLIHTVDLYPLRAEGLGNMNFGLQNGDMIFVPLAFNSVILEGGFVRVVAEDGLSKLRLPGKSLPEPTAAEAPTGKPETALKPSLVGGGRGDMRTSEADDRLKSELDAMPNWMARWQASGKAPAMGFEMLPGETVADALRYAGGLEVRAFEKRLSLRRQEPGKGLLTLDVPLEDGGKGTPLHRGDVLSALPLREDGERTVELAGWVRVPGPFARTEGLRVGDLLKREQQLLPDTYLGRGEMLRRKADGTTEYLAFDVAKALGGDPAHNLSLMDRDRIELFRLEDLRLRKTVRVLGPVSRAGLFEFHQGMRASDLLFRAGVPLQQADRLVAELAHTREGQPSQVLRLDLGKLLSSENSSPVDLKDDQINPLLEPFDQLTVYGRPDYRPHRTVTLSGQVRRPGVYTLDSDRVTLKDLVARAGGLTLEAMPKAGIFLRKLAEVDPEAAKAAKLAGVDADDPTAKGVNDVLNRLSEIKRNTTTGQLQKSPVLHGLQTGALNRLIVNMQGLLEGDPKAEVSLQHGDEIIIPRRTDAAYVVGETASPFAVYKVNARQSVKDLINLAGGYTHNADKWNVRLMKADGRIIDSWVESRRVEPGDTVLVPQRFRRDVSWQESLTGLATFALLVNTLK